MRLTFAGFVVNIGINMFMIPYPEYATLIAAFATMMAFFTMASTSYLMTRKIYPVDYNISKIILILVYAFGVVVISINSVFDSYIIKLMIACGFIPYLFLIKALSVTEIKTVIRKLKPS